MSSSLATPPARNASSWSDSENPSECTGGVPDAPANDRANRLSNDLRVLLFSPVEGRDPPSGDAAYTQALLADPPPGVVYTSYAEAIESGWLTMRGRRPRHGAFGPHDALLLPLRAAESLLRSSGATYRPAISLDRLHVALCRRRRGTAERGSGPWRKANRSRRRPRLTTLEPSRGPMLNKADPNVETHSRR